MIKKTPPLAHSSSGPCFQIESFWLFRVGGKTECHDELVQLVTRLAVSPNADNHFFCQKKRLACLEAELNVSIILHCGLRKTIGDELSDVVHDERLGGIAVEEAVGFLAVSLAHALSI